MAVHLPPALSNSTVMIPFPLTPTTRTFKLACPSVDDQSPVPETRPMRVILPISVDTAGSESMNCFVDAYAAEWDNVTQTARSVTSNTTAKIPIPIAVQSDLLSMKLFCSLTGNCG